MMAMQMGPDGMRPEMIMPMGGGAPGGPMMAMQMGPDGMRPEMIMPMGGRPGGPMVAMEMGGRNGGGVSPQIIMPM